MHNLLPRLALPALLLVASPASAVTRYVDVNSPNPVPPYTSWITAANVIQDAVDAADPGDEVLVTNGVYATGGKAIHGTMTNRVAVDKPLTLLSVNGREFTIIQGYQLPGTTNGDGAIRCEYLTNGAGLSGFTLTNGATRRWPEAGAGLRERSGGGVWCESSSAVIFNCKLVSNCADAAGGGSFDGTLYRCILTGNSAWSPSGPFTAGGGSALGNLYNCILAGNSADYGGGVYSISSNSTINNCTLTGNSAIYEGGGSRYGVLNNCIVYFNAAPKAGDNYSGSILYSSTTTPMPIDGTGNITNAPLFVDTNGWADLRLQPDSPCINAGNNAYVTSTNDLDGDPRIMGGTVDMGAYEFQSPQSVISYAWLQQYNLPTDGSADFAHSDADPHNNYQEWKTWTDPMNELSFLRMLNPEPGTNGTVVRWQSEAGHSYSVERAADAAGSFSLLQSNIIGQAGATSFTDTNAFGNGPFLYRVGVPE